ncbi:Protein root UVB sensitive 4 [Durusdinium trenchii]|uniref:Protein root UVB sensitive 4 n=1 Tax=Durusdinium trenchii TaxID=1381693 RepID=A0ABP0JIK8_9DINO
MATQAMLLAVGVGTKQSIPLAAVTAWVLKDGIGHVVAIAFGTFINQRFDSDPKRFRFQAAVLGKLADLVSILTLHWPQLFLPLSALGGAFSRLSANTGASCRPKIYETFARISNLGDIMRPCSAILSIASLYPGDNGAQKLAHSGSLLDGTFCEDELRRGVEPVDTELDVFARMPRESRTWALGKAEEARFHVKASASDVLQGFLQASSIHGCGRRTYSI